MTRWLLISAAVIAGQILLAYVVGGLLRRATNDRTSPIQRTSARVLAFPRRSLQPRSSGRRRAVGR